MYAFTEKSYVQTLGAGSFYRNIQFEDAECLKIDFLTFNIRTH